MANGNENGKFDRRGFLAFVSGGVVTLSVTLVVMVLTIGGERQKVLDHVATTEPLRAEAAIHLKDSGAHLSEKEAEVLAALPSKMNEIDSRMTRMEQELRETRRAVEEILRRVPR